MVRKEGMDNLIIYEIKAKAFQTMTGMLAPGKDSREVNPTIEERRIAYEEWQHKNWNIIKAILNATEEILG